MLVGSQLAALTTEELPAAVGVGVVLVRHLHQAAGGHEGFVVRCVVGEGHVERAVGAGVRSEGLDLRQRGLPVAPFCLARTREREEESFQVFLFFLQQSHTKRKV